MGRKSVIDEVLGIRLQEAVAELGSRRKAAAALGLSIGSVNRYFDSLPATMAPVLSNPLPTPTQVQVLRSAETNLFETAKVLTETYQRIDALVTAMAQEIHAAQGKVLATFSPKQINAYTAAIRESRQCVQMSVRVLELLTSVDEIRAFQTAVVEAIGEADAETRRRIITRLQDRRALAITLFNPGGGAS